MMAERSLAAPIRVGRIRAILDVRLVCLRLIGSRASIGIERKHL